jgi:hypothetical protein
MEQRQNAAEFAAMVQKAAGGVSSSQDLLKRIADGRITLNVDLDELVKADLAEAVAIAVQAKQRPSLEMPQRIYVAIELAKQGAAGVQADQKNLLMGCFPAVALSSARAATLYPREPLPPSEN